MARVLPKFLAPLLIALGAHAQPVEVFRAAPFPALDAVTGFTLTPDGQYLVYVRNAQPTLVSVRADNPAVSAPVSAFGQSIDFSVSRPISPDGRLFCYQTKGPRGNALHIAHLDGSAPLITLIDGDTMTVSGYPTPEFSSDSQWLLVTNEDRTQLIAFSTAAGQSAYLLHESSGERIKNIKITRDSQWVLFQVDNTLYARQLNGPSQLNYGETGSFLLTPDSSYVIFGANGAVWQAPIGLDSPPERISPRTSTPAEYSFVLSPDGTQIAISGNGGLSVVSIATPHPQFRVAGTDPIKTSFRWSPQGQRIAYYGPDGGIMVASLGSGALPRRLLHAITLPNFTSNDRYAVFRTGSFLYAAAADYSVLDLESENEALSIHGDFVRNLAIDPVRDRVYFTTLNLMYADLADPGNSVPLTSDGVKVSIAGLRITPDGTRLFTGTDGYTILECDLETLQVRQFLADIPPDTPAAQLLNVATDATGLTLVTRAAGHKRATLYRVPVDAEQNATPISQSFISGGDIHPEFSEVTMFLDTNPSNGEVQFNTMYEDTKYSFETPLANGQQYAPIPGIRGAYAFLANYYLNCYIYDDGDGNGPVEQCDKIPSYRLAAVNADAENTTWGLPSAMRSLDYWRPGADDDNLVIGWTDIYNRVYFGAAVPDASQIPGVYIGFNKDMGRSLYSTSHTPTVTPFVPSDRAANTTLLLASPDPATDPGDLAFPPMLTATYAGAWLSSSSLYMLVASSGLYSGTVDNKPPVLLHPETPDWLLPAPDGRHALFTSPSDAPDAPKTLYVTSFDATTPPAALGSVAPPPAQRPEFSPDSSRAVFLTADNAGHELLLSATTDATGPRITLGPQTGGAAVTSFAISSDSTQVAYLQTNGDHTAVYSIPIDGGTPILRSHPYANVSSFRWVGNAIYFTGDDSSGDPDVLYASPAMCKPPGKIPFLCTGASTLQDTTHTADLLLLLFLVVMLTASRKRRLCETR